MGQAPCVKEDEARNHRQFWDRHPGLVWSNREAPDDAFIGAALRQGRFLQLLDIAAEFGLDRLKRVWRQEQSCGDLAPGVLERAEEVMNILDEAHERAIASRHRNPLAST